MDWTINLPTIIAVIGPVVGCIIWLARIGEQVHANAKDIADLQQHKNNEHKDMRLEIAAAKASIVVTNERLNEVRLEAAQKYVTHDALSAIKREVIEEIQRMEKRLEAQLDRAIESSRDRGGK